MTRFLPIPLSCISCQPRGHPILQTVWPHFHDSKMHEINLNITSFFIIAISYITSYIAVLFFPTKILLSRFFDSVFMANGLLSSSVFNTSLTLPKLPFPISFITIYWFIFFFPSRCLVVDIILLDITEDVSASGICRIGLLVIRGGGGKKETWANYSGVLLYWLLADLFKFFLVSGTYASNIMD